MILEQHDFQRIFAFVSDVAKEQEKTVQLIMFTGSPLGQAPLPIEDRDLAMQLLEKAILQEVNGDDSAICYYSSVQRIVIFVNEAEADLKQTASDILKKFYQMYDKRNMEMSYDIALI